MVNHLYTGDEQLMEELRGTRTVQLSNVRLDIERTSLRILFRVPTMLRYKRIIGGIKEHAQNTSVLTNDVNISCWAAATRAGSVDLWVGHRNIRLKTRLVSDQTFPCGDGFASSGVWDDATVFRPLLPFNRKRLCEVARGADDSDFCPTTL